MLRLFCFYQNSNISLVKEGHTHLKVVDESGGDQSKDAPSTFLASKNVSISVASSLSTLNVRVHCFAFDLYQK